MDSAEKKSLIALPVILLIIFSVAFAGSQDGQKVFGLPIFILIGIFILFIQWLVFLPSYMMKTEEFFDLTGSLTYISAIWLSFVYGNQDLRSLVISIMVSLWAARLGFFLFTRVKRSGKDGRFDEIKVSFIRFLVAWTLQALWILFTLAAALIITTSNKTKDLSYLGYLGLIIWVLGFSIEIVADRQKSKFRSNPANAHQFIKNGLWSLSRHPNYFGEILLWIGVAIMAIPVMSGWQFIGLISPAFVYFLLVKVSGIPILEKRADEKWGGQDDYETYKRTTPALLLKFW